VSGSRAYGAFWVPAGRASLRPRSPLGAVPWLSGRASASHAEGRWFDPSRDHKSFPMSEAIIRRNMVGRRWRSRVLQGQNTAKRFRRDWSEGRPACPRPRRCVEFVVVEVGIDVRSHRDRSMAHGLLQQTQISARPASQRGIRMPQIMDPQGRAADLDDCPTMRGALPHVFRLGVDALDRWLGSEAPAARNSN
jgi:hypothetical protein